MLWLLFLAFPCLGGSAPTAPSPVLKSKVVGILGGQGVPRGKWPWQVSLRIYNYRLATWEHICGGSIIHPEWVLTAAHCIYRKDEDPSTYRVMVGEVFLYKGQKLRTIHQIIKHPDAFISHLGSDVALLKLATPLVLSHYIWPVPLPRANDNFTATDDCWVTGWGAYYKVVPMQPPYQLQEVKVPLQDEQTCEAAIKKENPLRYQTKKIILNDMLCAGAEGRGPCPGDSGGPLVCWKTDRWILVGVASWETECSGKLPAVFARVQSYLDWIQGHIKP